MPGQGGLRETPEDRFLHFLFSLPQSTHARPSVCPPRQRRSPAGGPFLPAGVRFLRATLPAAQRQGGEAAVLRAEGYCPWLKYGSFLYTVFVFKQAFKKKARKNIRAILNSRYHSICSYSFSGGKCKILKSHRLNFQKILNLLHNLLLGFRVLFVGREESSVGLFGSHVPRVSLQAP